jgi:hypothetical protein
MDKKSSKKQISKVIFFTSLFWISIASLVITFFAYGNARYNSGVNAGFDKAQALLQSK